MTLGVWHPYKQANTVVWSHFGPRFLAPFFNHLVPGSNFRRSARLVTIVTFFTYLRLSLPSIAAEMQAAIVTARQQRSRPLVLAYLLSLRDLLFFMIPVVGTHTLFFAASICAVRGLYCWLLSVCC